MRAGQERGHADVHLQAALHFADDRTLDRALRFVEGLEAGYVWINDVETRFPAVPFGGWRDSGVGVEHGLEEVLSMTRIRSVNIKIHQATTS